MRAVIRVLPVAILALVASGCRWIGEQDLNTAFVREPNGPYGAREAIVFCTELDESQPDAEPEHRALLLVSGWYGEGTYEVFGDTVRVRYNVWGPTPSAVEDRLEFDLDQASSPQLPGPSWDETSAPEPCSIPQ